MHKAKIKRCIADKTKPFYFPPPAIWVLLSAVATVCHLDGIMCNATALLPLQTFIVSLSVIFPDIV